MGERFTIPDPFMTHNHLSWESDAAGKCTLRDTNGATMLELILSPKEGWEIITVGIPVRVLESQ